MKNVTSTNEPVNPCCDESDGKRLVMFASRPYPRFFPRLQKKSCEGRPGYEARPGIHGLWTRVYTGCREASMSLIQPYTSTMCKSFTALKVQPVEETAYLNQDWGPLQSSGVPFVNYAAQGMSLLETSSCSFIPILFLHATENRGLGMRLV